MGFDLDCEFAPHVQYQNEISYIWSPGEVACILLHEIQI